MLTETMFAQVICSSIAVSEVWYTRLFGRGPDRRPMKGLAEWLFAESAEVQLLEDRGHVGGSTLTLGVLPSRAEMDRLAAVGLELGTIEDDEDFFIMRMRDPDQNKIVFAIARS